MNWKRWNLDDVEFAPMPGTPGGGIAVLVPPGGDGAWMMAVKFPPHHVVASHWHGADAFYLVMSGEMRVGEEGTYRNGDVRWVKAGTFYGPEFVGPDGVVFLLSGHGDPAVIFDEATATSVGSIVRD